MPEFSKNRVISINPHTNKFYLVTTVINIHFSATMLPVEFN